MNKTSSKLTNFTCFYFLVTFLINLFEAPANAIGKLSFQQLLQRLTNLSPCENKAFSLKFPSLTSMMIRMPFLYVQVCNHNVRLTVR